MNPLLVAFGVFALLAVVFGLAWKGTTLSKLELGPEERVLFELEGLTVDRDSLGGKSRSPNSVVRVTNERIIIAQRALLTKDPLLRYVLSYSGCQSEGAGLVATLKSGYLSCEIDPAEIREDSSAVVFPLRGGAIVGASSVRVPVEDLGPWRDAGLLSQS